MSSIPTKQIDGDAAIGRDVSVGGKATVRGSATIGHNLKVEGWLDAPNVKGPNKGLFKSATQLREAYPTPHEGWWALVGNTLPAQVYMADGGTWVAQTNADGSPKLAGNPTVDSTEYMEAVEQMTGDLEAVKIDVNQNKEDIRNLRSTQTTHGQAISDNRTAADNAQKRADSAYDLASTANTNATTAQMQADVAMPKTIHVNSLNGMGATQNVDMLKLIRKGAVHSRYTVVDDTNIVGVLDIFSDNSTHVFTQVLETHYSIEDGKLQTNSHWDNKIFRYFRSFNVNASNLDADKGSWSDWQEYIPENVPQLDGSGKILIKYLPNYVDDVVEFNAMVEDITLQTAPTTKKSTDAGCMIVYNKDTDCFVLAETIRTIGDIDWGEILRPTSNKSAISPQADMPALRPTVTPEINEKFEGFWSIDDAGTIVISKSGYRYYTQWDTGNYGLDAEKFGTETNDGRKPVAGKIYTCTSDNKTYRWGATSLTIIGNNLELGHETSNAYPGDEGAQLMQKLEWTNENLANTTYRLEILNPLRYDGEWDGKGAEPTSGVWYTPNGEGGYWFQSFGDTNFYGYAEEEYNSDMTANPNHVFVKDYELYHIGEDGRMAKIGGASVGNTYNLTNEVPLSDPEKLFYSIDSKEEKYNAPKVVYAQGKATLGMSITFAIAKGSWKTYQYVGNTLEPTATEFFNPDNWIDTAGMSAGSEPLINVNSLCEDIAYTLSTAITAVRQKESDSGIKYLKPGIILTYKTAEQDSKGNPVWKAYQFTRKVADIDPADDKPWVEFGGGGKAVIETKDEPKAGGTDAFSTGGAAKHLPTKNKVTQEDGTVSIQLQNEAGEDVGEPIQFFASQGGGGEVSGTIVSITFKDSPLYGAVGKEIIGRACIRSITKVGDKEQTNAITSLRLVDRDTNVTIREWTVNQRSSDEEEYSFEVPFSGMFDGAGERRFRLEAVDDTDTTGQRNLRVIAIDATIQCDSVIQPLHYTTEYAIPFGGTRDVEIPLYKFPQNVSEKGIQAFVEVLWNGEWRPLTATPPTHFDAYTNTAFFNPSNLFGGGEKMQHGAYPVRIHGRDVASGVEGNTVYTAVMCIDPNSSVPLVALRYNDTSGGEVRLYDRVSIEVAAYNPDPKVLATHATVKADGKVIGRYELGASQTDTAEMQVSGYKNDGSEKLTITAESINGNISIDYPLELSLIVRGSAIDASLMSGALYHFDFSGRSNNEPDHEIADGDYNVELDGANWSTNGFARYLGQNCMRVAENVRGRLNHAPFATRTLEGTGMAWQAMIATNNIKDEDAMLLKCIDPDSGAGFYVKGNKVGLKCASGSPAKIERRFPCGEMHTISVVVEPSSIAINRNGTDWCTMRLYIDGDLVGAIGYNPGGSRLLNTNYIEFDGREGDLYVYYMIAYQSYYDWSQAFRNYVIKLPDTDAMISEFDRENVLVSQNAEGSTSMRPSAPLMFAKGMPYCVFVASDEVHNKFDFGDGGTDKDGTSTKTKFKMTVYYYHPTMPWRSFKAVNCEIRRQGTTSAKRPKKNYRIYIKKCDQITALYPEYTNEDALITYALFAQKKVRVTENSIPVDVITIKVDYSNSGGANDCSVCDMVNATYRALGNNYLTPAQRCYDGTWDKGDVHLSGLEMNHSTANHPIAVFRSNSDTLQNVWFEAKGNWKEDKGEQVALGFKDVPGYNKGCLNFQDESFKWICGLPGESLVQMQARFKTIEGLDESMPYLLMPYCSRNYVFMRYQGGKWTNTTGSWIWNGNKATITGDVLNPVGGFELLTYEAFDWWKGVSSVEDMMKPGKNISKWVQALIDDKDSPVSGTEFPAWTFYFECMVDNDALQADLAMGNIVPFELYIQMRFCDWCDYDKHPEEWLERWKAHAYKFRNVLADMVYLADADYQNEFDSLSKNHQPMHFLLEGHNVIAGIYDPDKEGATATDGFNCDFVPTMVQPVIQQPNKKYDIDGAYMADNEGGDTGEPEADITKPSDQETQYANPWAGWGAIPWRAYLGTKEMGDGERKIQTANGAIEYQDVVSAMRNVQITLADGRTINPFSPDGAKYYFIEQHLQKWQKVVSSYDGIRKYIQYTGTSDSLYFYALQGLGLAALAQFIEQRWRYRDGFYKTGGFFSGVISGRIACGDNASIRIKAAKSGYFGMGNDSSGSLSADGAVFIAEGEEFVFRNFSHQQGALLYIYQSDRIAEIEFTDMSLGENFDFGVMKLVERIIIGGENYTQYNIGYNPLAQFNQSDLPFLKELDIRNIPTITKVDASKWPRLETLLAEGTALAELDLAQTSPVSTLQLPATVTRLDFVNLPNLAYPGGLTIAGMQNVTRLMLSGCPNIDPMQLINGIIGSSSIRYIRLPDVNITAPSAILRSLRESGAKGLDAEGNAYTESGQCSGISGRWIMSDLIEDSEVKEFAAYFPQLTIHNAQYSMVMYSDLEDDCENITNLDNQTGYLYGTKYVASGHFKRLEEMSHAVKGTYDTVEKCMNVEDLDDNNYNYMADGSSIDLADSSGMGYDIFKDVPDNWYKGVNDFKNQLKYGFRSINKSEPISTSTKLTRKKLAELLVEENAALVLSTERAGEKPVTTLNSAMNVYAIDVKGMRQVRWPGVNSAEIGCVFLDAEGRIVEVFRMAVANAQFDFIAGEDYIFTDVPGGAERFMFTSQRGCEELEAIATDSTAIEAIDPDWVLCKEFLIGVYGMGQDGLNRARSISNTKAVVGTGTATTSSEWTYDAEGKVTNLSVPANLNRTRQDCINLCEMRGEGFHAISYEQSKNLANIIMELTGTRDIQSICGRGNSAGYTTGTQTINGKNINAYGNITLLHNAGNVGNLIFGIQEFVGCNYEWMSHVAVNVKSFKDWKAKRCPTTDSTYPIDARWHIYDVTTDTEREVQGINLTSGYCIGRVRFGRYMDYVPSKMTSDNSQWNKNYSDGAWYSHDRCRVVGRANHNASAFGGLVFSSANNVSSYSSASYGSRLAFSGIIKHIDKPQENEAS